MKNSNKKAFTLVELLVVIAIIGILFVVLISKVDFATDKAKATGVQTDFRSFQLAAETVARENAGLSPLVKLTGDTNANGIADDGETVTYDYSALADALNKTLDPKLHVVIDNATGEITMKNDAKDPWKTEYVGKYLQATAGDKATRGAIVFYSAGANLAVEMEAEVVNGEVVVEYADAAKAEDSYSVATIYTFKNGYGEVISTSTGFSNNQ